MHSRRVKELKIKYAVSLIEILRTISEAGQHSEEHLEALRQIERALLSCIESPPPDWNCDQPADRFSPDTDEP